MQRWTLFAYMQKKRGITLSQEQRQAVERAASSRLLASTGGPRLWQNIYHTHHCGAVEGHGQIYPAGRSHRKGSTTPRGDGGP